MTELFVKRPLASPRSAKIYWRPNENHLLNSTFNYRVLKGYFTVSLFSLAPFVYIEKNHHPLPRLDSFLYIKVSVRSQKKLSKKLHDNLKRGASHLKKMPGSHQADPYSFVQLFVRHFFAFHKKNQKTCPTIIRNFFWDSHTPKKKEKNWQLFRNLRQLFWDLRLFSFKLKPPLSTKL